MKKDKREIILVIVILAIITGATYSVYLYREYRSEQKFQKAIEYIQNDDYENAYLLLDKLPSNGLYEDVKMYVEAKIIYNPEDYNSIEEAQVCLECISFQGWIDGLGIFSQRVSSFDKELSKQYKIAKREAFKGTIPYIGMEEDDLLYTDFGSPISVEVSTGWHSGEYKTYSFEYESEIYDVLVSYYRSSIGTVISIHPDPNLK